MDPVSQQPDVNFYFIPSMNKVEINGLKEKNSIVDVLKELGIEVSHNRFRCPASVNHAHGDRTPSVSLWSERGQFKCWVCPDIKGDVIDLVRIVHGCSFTDALKFLSARSHHPHSQKFVPSLKTPVPIVQPSLSSTLNKPIFAEKSKPPLQDSAIKIKVIQALLEFCKPIDGKVAAYLQKRRIFKKTWVSQRLCMIDDYAAISKKLASVFSLETLEQAGIFNPAGHLRFYRHNLIFPYFDQQRQAIYLQARSIDPETKPKELSLSGPIPIPYNIQILDGIPGQIYLCEGVIDALTLIEQGFPSVGVPGAGNFKAAWVSLFKNKTVHVAFDPDAPGESGAKKAMDTLSLHGIEVKRLAPPRGMDLNEWFLKG